VYAEVGIQKRVRMIQSVAEAVLGRTRLHCRRIVDQDTVASMREIPNKTILRLTIRGPALKGIYMNGFEVYLVRRSSIHLSGSNTCASGPQYFSSLCRWNEVYPTL